MKNPRSILITGASSGIGAALAQTYAGPGRHLHLGGRNPDRLSAVAAKCRAKGATCSTVAHDVTDAAAMQQWISEAAENGPLDLVIANAGISAGNRDSRETEDQSRRIFAVNVDGVLNTVHPALTAMLAQAPGEDGWRGQIAIMSSLASFRGLGGAPSYCASKAAERIYGEALRSAHTRDGIAVSVICPGFIDTPLTQGNRFHMPMLMDVDRATPIIVRGLARNRGRIAFPFAPYALVWLLQALPVRASELLVRELPYK